MDYKLHLPDGYEKKPLPGLKQWVEALRSGKYKQGKQALCKDGKYCCLGVRCEVEGFEGIASGEYTSFGCDLFMLPSKSTAYPFISDSGDFPSGVRIAIGGLTSGALVGCNDSGLTFLQIADIIEAVWYHVEESK